jgi:hypothetical protein
MSQFKKCKVILLPTEKAIDSVNWYYPNAKTLVINGKQQHLYIVSDEKIKEGDWVYNIETKVVYPLTLQRGGSLEKAKQLHKKIIAATDRTLIDKNAKYKVSGVFDEGLPQPSLGFIKTFIAEYDNSNVITDVMVEYEMDMNAVYDHKLCYNLKINPKDNTITIRKVKDSWSREELLPILKACWNGGAFWGSNTPNSHYFDKWIEENL